MRRHHLKAFLALGLFSGAAAAQTPAQPPSAPVREVRLPKGTPVRVKMDYGVSAKAARVGDPVYLKTVGNVGAKGVVIIPEGSRVTGRVTEASEAGARSGASLVIEMELVDTGTARIRLAGTTADRGKVRTSSISEGVVTVPFGTQRSKNANIEAGTEFTAYTDRDY